MKAINYLMAAILTFGLCLAPLYDDACATSNAQDTATKSMDTVKTTKSTVAEIPKNININSADKDTLALLPGIGPSKADAIVKYRKDNGDFNSIDDLTQVKGIGDKTFTKLKPYLKKL